MMVAWHGHRGMGRSELEVMVRGAPMSYGRGGAQGHDRGATTGWANCLESRQIGQAASAPVRMPAH